MQEDILPLIYLSPACLRINKQPTWHSENVQPGNSYYDSASLKSGLLDQLLHPSS